MHLDEEVDVGDDQRKGVEFTECAVGGLKQQVDGGVFPAPFVIDRNGSKLLYW